MNDFFWQWFCDIFKSNLIKRGLKINTGFAAFTYFLFSNALKNFCYSKEKWSCRRRTAAVSSTTVCRAPPTLCDWSRSTGTDRVWRSRGSWPCRPPPLPTHHSSPSGTYTYRLMCLTLTMKGLVLLYKHVLVYDACKLYILNVLCKLSDFIDYWIKIFFKYICM